LTRVGHRNNLAAKHPEKVEEMQALLKQIREQGYSAGEVTEHHAATR